jgi:hypothetical protein
MGSAATGGATLERSVTSAAASHRARESRLVFDISDLVTLFAGSRLGKRHDLALARVSTSRISEL